MPRSLCPILALVAACADRERDPHQSPPAEALSWLGEPVAVSPTSAKQHHATLVLDPQGRTLVAHSAEHRVVVRMLERDFAESWALLVPGVAHHPQVAARPGGFLLVVNADFGAGLVYGQSLDADGPLGEPVLLSDHPQAIYPDLSVHGERGLAVWAEGEELGGMAFQGDFGAPVPLEAPPSEGNVDPPSVRATGAGAWAVWTETNPTEAVVKVRALGDDGAWLGEAVEVDRLPGVGSGRPTVAVHESGRFTVAWRWFDEAQDPDRTSFGAWTRTYEPDGAPLGEARQLGVDADRPVVDTAGRCVLVAWELDGVGYLQVLDDDGVPLGGPVELGAPGTANRLYVDVEEVDGRLEGRVSWEGHTRPALDLWVRPFEVVGPACR